MSAVELAIEKVKQLDEAHARELLEWLESQEVLPSGKSGSTGAEAMLGFARRFHPEPRTTAQWMAELREGESE